MFKPNSPQTDNLFLILIGEEKLKWDSFWNFLHWLCIPTQGHQLDRLFVNKLLMFAFHDIPKDYQIKQEYNIDPSIRNSGKWPDLAIASPSLEKPSDYLLIMEDLDRSRVGDSRKLANLLHYVEKGKELTRHGKLKLIVITNTSESSCFQKLRDLLGESTENSDGKFSWSLLSVRTIALWLREITPHSNTVREFIEWSKFF
jgi:hypothetical protein